MSNLAQYLGAGNARFDLWLTECGRRSSNKNADIKILTDILKRQTKLYKTLGLDINDTTAAELTLALKNRYKKDKKFLVEWLPKKIETTDINWRAVYAGNFEIDSKMKSYVQILKKLAAKHAAIKFWHENLGVAVFTGGEIVSANFFDVMNGEKGARFFRQFILAKLLKLHKV